MKVRDTQIGIAIDNTQLDQKKNRQYTGLGMSKRAGRVGPQEKRVSSARPVFESGTKISPACFDGPTDQKRAGLPK